MRSHSLLPVLLLIVVAPLFAAEPVAPAEPPVATFFQAPSITSLTFSPDGKRVACLIPFEHRLNLAVIDLEKGTKNLLTNFKDRQAVSPMWASDDRILFRVDDDGKESFALYAVDRDGGNPGILASGYSKAATIDEANVRFRSVLRRLEHDPKNILVLADLTYADWPDVALMNVSTGKMTRVVEAPGNVDRYILDHNNEVRLAIIEQDDIRRVLVRDVKTHAWSTLAEHPRDHAGWEPLSFDGDNRTLFITSNLGRKTTAIYRYDLETRQQLDLVFGDDTYDAANVIYDASKHRVVGVSYEADRTRFVWLDDEMRALEKKLSTSLPDTVHQPGQFARDGSKIIFFSYNDRDPGVYYLYDKKRQKLNELAVIKPGIDPEKMSPMKPITLTARDGLPLHGYLTIPRGRAPKKLPLIVHPHGGPFDIRDSWEYDPEVQFYASRGYAVLQINYRGSGGYGDAFVAAGWKKWGREMQDDLTDGVKWAIAEGIADPARVVISGASYGGYATMAGLAFTPELYCAGVNYVGVTDIALLIPKTIPAARMVWIHSRIGDPGNAADRQRLHDTSPVNFADRIRAPVLMAYGKNDPRVHIDHGYDMERALKKAGKPYELIIEEDEGHGFHKEEKSIAFFTRVDAFLKKNVPPAAN